jgi:peroxiredoxin
MKYLFITLFFLAKVSLAQVTGEDILKQCATKLKSLKSISYNLYSEAGAEKASVDITVNRVKDFPLFEFAQLKVSGLMIADAGSRQVRFASDGTKFEYFDPKSNELTRIENANMSKVFGTGLLPELLLSLVPYEQKDPLLPFIRKLKHVDILHDTVVYTVPCYRLSVNFEIDDPRGKAMVETQLLIGKNDMLLYGMETKSSKRFIKIKEVDTPYDAGYFSLISSGTFKTVTGMEPKAEGLLSINTMAPGWTLPSPSLKEITLQNLKGNVVVLDFWGTWCVPCIKAMPDIQAIADHFKDAKVTVIGVSVETEQATDPAGFVKRKGFTYPIALNGKSIAAAYKVMIFPSVYIIDQTGMIVHRESGTGRENFKEDMIEKIQNLLSKNK